MAMLKSPLSGRSGVSAGRTNPGTGSWCGPSNWRIAFELLCARHRGDPRPSPAHEQFHDRMEPFVGIDAAGFHEHYIQRRIGFCRERRPAARAISARNMEPLEPISSKTAVSY